MSAHLIIICGPTATGKSDLAVELAQAIDAEIINADSMQLYRGMDIGTAKLTLDERKGVPHHLLDIFSVTEDASVASYQVLARNTIDQILATGKSAIVVGGTGLYIKSIVDEMNFPDTDPAIRLRLESEAAEFGIQRRHRKLTLPIPVASFALSKSLRQPDYHFRQTYPVIPACSTQMPSTSDLPSIESYLPLE
jgi:tRNA dimethylallyltransferase